MLKFTRSLCYTIRVKVGEFMVQGKTDLKNMMEQSNGILKTSEAMDAGFSKFAFYDFVKKSHLEKIAQGIYAMPDVWIDEMYLLQSRFPKVIFSHDTALYLHDMSEMEPMPLTVTVPANYNTAALLEQAKVFYVKNTWYDIGVCEVSSPDGFPVRAYDRERTVCDIIRKQNDMDSAVFNYALRQYVRNKDKDYVKLMRYAKIFRMESRIRTVMGVLL